MSTTPAIDLTELMDNRAFNSFNVKLIVISFLVVLLDGYAIPVVGLAAPDLIKAWGIGDPGVFGPVFGASMVGMLVGAPLIGYIGDRFGRRTAIILSCLIYGAFTWVIVFASTLPHLIVLRFLAGIGIGGVLANIGAINAEFAPRRFQATAIIVTFTGTAFGGSLPGPVTALLVPNYGWQLLFHIGGIGPIIIAGIVALTMPESIRFLALKVGRQADVRRLMKQLEPAMSFGPTAEFVVRHERQIKELSPKYLFTDGFALITVLLWLIFALNLMGYFFLISWMPTLLSGANIPVAQAALITGVLQLGGVVGALSISRLVDKFAMKPVAFLFAIAVPIIGSIGYVGIISRPMLVAIVFLAGFCTLGIQLALNALASIIYPTALRASGVGWALGIGRVGSIVGPIVGGILISMHLTLQQLYLFAAIPFFFGAIAAFLLINSYAQKRGAAPAKA